MGITVCPSIARRAGGLTSATCMTPVPVGQPLATGAVGAGTTAVGADEAGVEPALLVAVTVERSVAPASTCFSW